MVRNRKFQAAQKIASFLLFSSVLLLILEDKKDGMSEFEIKKELEKEFDEKMRNNEQFMKELLKIATDEGCIKQVSNKKFKLTPVGIKKVDFFHQCTDGYKAATEK